MTSETLPINAGNVELWSRVIPYHVLINAQVVACMIGENSNKVRTLSRIDMSIVLHH